MTKFYASKKDKNVSILTDFVVGVLFSLIMALIAMTCWNYLALSFDLPTVTFWQALAVRLMVRGLTARA